VQEVNRLAVDGGGELREGVQPRLLARQSNPRAQYSASGRRYSSGAPRSSRSPASGRAAAASGGEQAPAQVVDVGLGDVDAKRTDVRTLGLGLVGVCGHVKQATRQCGTDRSALCATVAGMKTSTRLLKLLALLQGRRDWSGPQLAEELGVTTRTVRNDVERIRDLGYPVHASPGVAGGYRLGAGTELPPLLLDHREAIAVAVGLRAAAAGAVAGVESVALAALAKLEQVMPARVRRRVRTLQQALVMAPSPATPPTPTR
jgi:biotin operon repressor